MPSCVYYLSYAFVILKNQKLKLLLKKINKFQDDERLRLLQEALGWKNKNNYTYKEWVRLLRMKFLFLGFLATLVFILILFAIYFTGELNSKSDSFIICKKAENELDFVEGIFKNNDYSEALKKYEKVSEVFTSTDCPSLFARLRKRQGDCLSNISELNEVEYANNYKNAIQYYKDALKIYHKDIYPNEYARTQNNLGLVYKKFSKFRDAPENLQQALDCFGNALKYFTIDSFPEVFAEALAVTLALHIQI